MSKSATSFELLYRQIASARKPTHQGTGRTRLKAQSRLKTISWIAMPQSPKGATIAAMMKATAGGQHSVRGFLASVARKRLKLKFGLQGGGRRADLLCSGSKGTDSGRSQSDAMTISRAEIGRARTDRENH